MKAAPRSAGKRNYARPREDPYQIRPSMERFGTDRRDAEPRTRWKGIGRLTGRMAAAARRDRGARRRSPALATKISRPWAWEEEEGVVECVVGGGEVTWLR